MSDDDDAFQRLEKGITSLLGKAVAATKDLPRTPETTVTVVTPTDVWANRSRHVLNLRDLQEEDLDSIFIQDSQGKPLSSRMLYSGMREAAFAQAQRAERDQPHDAGTKSAAVGAIGAATQAIVPSVSFKASEPDVLSKAARKSLISFLKPVCVVALVGAALVGALTALASVIAAFNADARSVDLTGGAIVAGSFALIALTSLVLQYFTVMGFKNVEYSGGVSGTNPATEEHPAEEEKGEGEKDDEEGHEADMEKDDEGPQPEK